MREIPKRIIKYVDKALSVENRKTFDGDSAAPYRVVVEFAEFGEINGHPAGFYLEVSIPRQVDNELGATVGESVTDRSDAAEWLRTLADRLESGQ